jgi:hypothetical protein
MPTVVLAVRNARGDDLTAVRVMMDRSPLTTGLGGNAIAVDPGPHTFTFEAEGYAPLDEDVLVREGEKERSLSVVLQGPAQARPDVGRPPPPAPTQTLQRGPSTRRWIALTTTGVGALGVGVGGILGLAALLKFESAERETGTQRHDDSVGAVNTGNVATVVMGAGGFLAAAGIVLWMTSPGHPTQVSTTGSGLLVRGSFW